MAKTSPTQRSLKLLRDLGFTCQIVEHWNAFARRRIDLFGIIDIVAIKSGSTGVLGVQTTTSDNLSARVHKAEAEETMKIWLNCGNRLLIHGWDKSRLVAREMILEDGKLVVVKVNDNEQD